MTRWLAAAKSVSTLNDKADETPAHSGRGEVSSVLSVLSKGYQGNIRPSDEGVEVLAPTSEGVSSFVSFRPEGVKAAAGAASPNTDGLTSPAEGVSSVSSVLSGGGNGISPASRDKNPRDLRRDLKLDPRPRPDDAEVYARALTLHGPMTYGTAMRVLGWGATRAGQAESALREAGRITFNSMGRAVLVEEAGKVEPSGESV